MDYEEIRELTEVLASAIRNISYGGISGPTGLEGLTMAIAGDYINTPLSESVLAVAEALNNIAEAIREGKQ